MISDQNCMTQGSVTTLLHPFWNRPNTGFGQFKYFIDVVLSWFEIKFIHFFWGGRGRVLETKVAKFATWYSVYHFLAIWLVTLNKPWSLIGCFVFSVASSLAGEKRQSVRQKMVWFANKLHQLEPIRLQGPPVISNECNKTLYNIIYHHFQQTFKFFSFDLSN